MLCEQITGVLSQLSGCTVTSEGSRVVTQCLYPSFEPVHVYVAGFGDGFKVHDGGGAARSCWDHSRDKGVTQRALNRQAMFHDLKVVGDSLVCDVASPDWLLSGVLAVANASASAAFMAIEHAAATSDAGLRERIYHILREIIPEKKLARGYERFGGSGKKHVFDFGILYGRENLILIDAVSPHHVSIAAKYVSFADTKAGSDFVTGVAVYDRALDPEDAALMQQVADLMPFSGLRGGIRKEMLH